MVMRIKGDKIKVNGKEFTMLDNILMREVEKEIAEGIEKSEVYHPGLKVLIKDRIIDFPYILAGQSVAIKPIDKYLAKIEVWDHETMSSYYLEGFILKTSEVIR